VGLNSEIALFLPPGRVAYAGATTRDGFLMFGVGARLQSRLGFVGLVSSCGLNDG
jgi:hypothetical protein